jgi:hypothetical protein
MSRTKMPAPLARKAPKKTGQARALRRRWIEPALAVLFAAVAIVFASSLAVVTGLV